MYFAIAREFCRISLFWGRRTSDKTVEDYRNLAATKRNTGAAMAEWLSS